MEKLLEKLEKAKEEETSAYCRWMYYEAADRGYDYAGAKKARDYYNECSRKVRDLEAEIAKQEEEKC